MLNFPESAVKLFNEKLKSLKDNMPLFMADNEFARNISVDFDPKNYRINIRGLSKK
jgi:hypothetical protein